MCVDNSGRQSAISGRKSGACGDHSQRELQFLSGHIQQKASLFIQSHNSPPAMLRTPRQSHTKFNVVIARAVVFSEAGTHAWRPAEHKLQHVWRARETARAAGVLD
ncbi:uncharacterized protein LOC142584675 isoform X3 [Dermacentor variabilis]|uniref:uncharacterized protein LOC142559735 isoform X3 n=1 Tax=Dermacentor variabilis TaxID=34621 RepID=UPI003F5C52CA